MMSFGSTLGTSPRAPRPSATSSTNKRIIPFRVSPRALLLFFLLSLLLLVLSVAADWPAATKDQEQKS
jgi:hypothetical protein